MLDAKNVIEVVAYHKFIRGTARKSFTKVSVKSFILDDWQGSEYASVYYSLCKNCSHLEFFWSAFSPHAGKCGPEKTPNMDTFHAVIIEKDTLWNFSFKVFHEILI